MFYKYPVARYFFKSLLCTNSFKSRLCPWLKCSALQFSVIIPLSPREDGITEEENEDSPHCSNLADLMSPLPRIPSIDPLSIYWICLPCHDPVGRGISYLLMIEAEDIQENQIISYSNVF